jgi:hypothetical protein
MCEQRHSRDYFNNRKINYSTRRSLTSPEDLLKRVDFDSQSQRGRARELEDLRIESKESVRGELFRPGRRPTDQKADQRRWTSPVASSVRTYVRLVLEL